MKTILLKKVINKTKLAITLFMITACFSGESKWNKTSAKSDLNSGYKAINTSIEQTSLQLDELLTLDIAASEMDLPPEKASVTYDRQLDDTFTHSIVYSWRNVRAIPMDNPTCKESLELPHDDFVKLAWLKQTNLQSFKNENLIDPLSSRQGDEANLIEVPETGDYALWDKKKSELKTYFR